MVSSAKQAFMLNATRLNVGSLIQFDFKHLYLGWESGSIQLEEDFLKHLK